MVCTCYTDFHDDLSIRDVTRALLLVVERRCSEEALYICTYLVLWVLGVWLLTFVQLLRGFVHNSLNTVCYLSETNFPMYFPEE